MCLTEQKNTVFYFKFKTNILTRDVGLNIVQTGFKNILISAYLIFLSLLKNYGVFVVLDIHLISFSQVVDNSEIDLSHFCNSRMSYN